MAEQVSINDLGYEDVTLGPNMRRVIDEYKHARFGPILMFTASRSELEETSHLIRLVFYTRDEEYSIGLTAELSLSNQMEREPFLGKVLESRVEYLFNHAFGQWLAVEYGLQWIQTEDDVWLWGSCEHPSNPNEVLMPEAKITRVGRGRYQWHHYDSQQIGVESNDVKARRMIEQVDQEYRRPLKALDFEEAGLHPNGGESDE